jgi:hypothetical protein
MKTEITQNNKLLLHAENDELKSARNVRLSNLIFKIRNFFSKKIVRLVSTLIIIAVILYITLVSDVFIIKSVEITNSTGSSTFSFANSNNIKKSANLLIGQNYFTTNITQTVNEIISKDTFLVKGYSEKVLPNKIKINFYERTPYILYLVNDTYCVLIDDKSFVILNEKDLEKCKTYPKKYSVKLVQIQNSKNEYKAGLNSNSYITENLKDLLPALKEFGIEITSIIIKDNSVEITSSDGKTYYFSFENGFENQLLRFKITMNEIIYKKIDYKKIDLRYDRPVTQN